MLTVSAGVCPHTSHTRTSCSLIRLHPPWCLAKPNPLERIMAGSETPPPYPDRSDRAQLGRRPVQFPSFAVSAVALGSGKTMGPHPDRQEAFRRIYQARYSAIAAYA